MNTQIACCTTFLVRSPRVNVKSLSLSISENVKMRLREKFGSFCCDLIKLGEGSNAQVVVVLAEQPMISSIYNSTFET
jgi:hypothetical protein